MESKEPSHREDKLVLHLETSCRTPLLLLDMGFVCKGVGFMSEEKVLPW